MSRKKRDFSREIIPDPKFGDVLVAKLINCIMKNGKKGIAEKAVYAAFEKIKEVKKTDPVSAYKRALENIKPVIEVRSRRVGGANYQVPMEVPPKRQESLALRWLIKAMNARHERTLGDRLAGELMDALENRGGAVKKKEETHRMAEANRAFSHFKW